MPLASLRREPLKTKFITPSDSLIPITKEILDFKELGLHSNIFPAMDACNKIKNTAIVSVNSVFTIFSFEILKEAIHPDRFLNFLYPNLEVGYDKSKVKIYFELDMFGKNLIIPKENIELFLNDNKTVTVNIKVLNEEIINK